MKYEIHMLEIIDFGEEVFTLGGITNSGDMDGAYSVEPDKSTM